MQSISVFLNITKVVDFELKGCISLFRYFLDLP